MTFTPPGKRVASLLPVSEPGRSEVAQYIEQITQELYALARRKNLDLLAYFLTMANMEAQEQARSGDDH
ncbi:hypothetical protein ACFFJB_08020 [Camelimonas abortus]|uniref:Uncharacterized protein n=1 Tax=Camelimonas abortus TaxID=1017184 RepID=A0ABV7LEC4_9HYPH